MCNSSWKTGVKTHEKICVKDLQRVTKTNETKRWWLFYETTYLWLFYMLVFKD